MFPSDTATAKSTPRVNSVAPYRMHACPPIRSARTLLRWKVERTLGIGLRLTTASEQKERGPEALGFREALRRGKFVPLPQVLVLQCVHQDGAVVLPGAHFLES